MRIRIGDSEITLQEALAAVRYAASIPRALRRRMSADQARALVRHQLAHRETNFLALAREAIYENAWSPYLSMLRHAGVEFGDLDRMVHQDGLEDSLRRLHRAGVYLTPDEYRGVCPTVRGSDVFEVRPELMRHPRSAPATRLNGTGGTSGRSVPLPLALNPDSTSAPLRLWASDGFDWVHAIWAVPGSFTITYMVNHVIAGAPHARWFSQVDLAAPGLSPAYIWSDRVFRWGGLLAGVRIPRPEFVPLENPLPIARWMRGVLDDGRVPALRSFAGPAARLCDAAHDAGVDLEGAQFFLGGEPITEARMGAIRRVGGRALPGYSASEIGGVLSYACVAPQAPDEVHFAREQHALIQAEAAGAAVGLPPSALLFTSLKRQPGLVLLNVCIGDQAEVSERSCGCPFDQLGLTTHLHAIRGFSKVTAGGMMVADADLIRVLEQVLPAKFGGGATDYQLVEEEGAAGAPRVTLRVDPSVSDAEPAALIDAFLTALGEHGGPAKVMELQWRSGNVLKVERRPPSSTSNAKILHLIRSQSAAAAGADHEGQSRSPGGNGW